MERRLLLAILLVFLVLTVYQWMLPKPPAQAAGAAAGAASVAGQTTPSTGATPASAAQPAAPAVQLPAVEATTADTAERSVTLDNALVHAVFSNRGGVLTSWQLTKYHDASGRTLDLVPHEAPADSPKPFALKLDDPVKTARVNSALYATQQQKAGIGNAESVTFEYQDASGLHVRKQFTLSPNLYVLTVSTTVLDGDRSINPQIDFGPALGDVVPYPAGNGRNIRRAQGFYSVGGKVTRALAAALLKTPHVEGAYEFAGVETHYFMAAAVKPGTAAVDFTPLSVPVPNTTPPVARDYVDFTIRFAQPGPAQFYLGPKELNALRAVDPKMVPAIWFGMFSFLTVPLLSALNWIHGFVGNYGWSILVLTLLINLALFPLRHKSFVSMRKMQEIQPQVKVIQDRYAKLKMSDPARQKMNTELMDLYRSRGVNPASGCVPMLLTMPILFAFYNLLSEAIELRGAPFALWIHDLSVMDPYYVTPILMGASQLVQQRMAPAAADPAQQRMMLIMPVVFTFMFATQPSGLALYWLASNVLMIGQQQFTNYLIGPSRAPRPPADRKLKKVGEGKTENA